MVFSCIVRIEKPVFVEAFFAELAIQAFDLAGFPYRASRSIDAPRVLEEATDAPGFNKLRKTPDGLLQTSRVRTGRPAILNDVVLQNRSNDDPQRKAPNVSSLHLQR